MQEHFDDRTIDMGITARAATVAIAVAMAKVAISASARSFSP